MEKLCGSIGLSFILIWLAAWILFLAGANGVTGCAAITIACAILAVLSLRDSLALFRNIRVLQATLGFAFLLLFTLVALAIIRHYSGAGWDLFRPVFQLCWAHSRWRPGGQQHLQLCP